MKKIIEFVSVLVVSVIVLIYINHLGKIPEYSNYENDSGYSLKYPKEWVISSRSENDDGVSFDVGNKEVDVRVFKSLDHSLDIPDDDYKYGKQDFILANKNKAYLIEHLNGAESFLKIVLNKDDAKYTFLVSGPEKYIKNNRDLLLRIGSYLYVKRNLSSTFTFADRDIVLSFDNEPEEFLIDTDNYCVEPYMCDKYIKFDTKFGVVYKKFFPSKEINIKIVDQKYFDINFQNKQYSEKIDGDIGNIFGEDSFSINPNIHKFNYGNQSLISIKESNKVSAKLNDGTESNTEKVRNHCAVRLSDGKYFIVQTIYSGIEQNTDNCEYLISNLKSVYEVNHKFKK